MSNSCTNLKINDAKRFFKEILSQGSVAQSAVIVDAKQRGIKEKTLRNAKKELNVKSEKIIGHWYWCLPN